MLLLAINVESSKCSILAWERSCCSLRHTHQPFPGQGQGRTCMRVIIIGGGGGIGDVDF